MTQVYVLLPQLSQICIMQLINELLCATFIYLAHKTLNRSVDIEFGNFLHVSIFVNPAKLPCIDNQEWR